MGLCRKCHTVGRKWGGKGLGYINVPFAERLCACTPESMGFPVPSTTSADGPRSARRDICDADNEEDGSDHEATAENVSQNDDEHTADSNQPTHIAPLPSTSSSTAPNPALATTQRLVADPQPPATVCLPTKKQLRAYWDPTTFTSKLLSALTDCDVMGMKWSQQGDGKATIAQVVAAMLVRRELLHEQGKASQATVDMYPVEEVLMCKRGPWGNMGSSHPLHKNGDYDFVSICLSFFLHRFGRTLNSDVKSHVFSILLPKPTPNPVIYVPKAVFAVVETENHLFMINGTFYNTNKYLLNSDEADSSKISNTKLADFLADLCDEIIKSGPWEFNSRPYVYYLMLSLLILHDTATEQRLQEKLKKALDLICFLFALGSMNYRSAGPFRRRRDHLKYTSLFINPLGLMMMVWQDRVRPGSVSVPLEHIENIRKGAFAIACSYTPHADVVEAANEKSGEYFSRVNHGDLSSPELMCANSNFLLVAGGLEHRKSHVSSDDTVIFFQGDGAVDKADVIRLSSGKREKLGTANNTGVFFNICLLPDGVVTIPERYSHFSLDGEPEKGWRAYHLFHCVVVVYEGTLLSLAGVFDDTCDENDTEAEQREKVQRVFDAVKQNNATLETPKGAFHFSADAPCVATRAGVHQVHFDVANISTAQWIITGVNGQDISRTFSEWPLLEIHGKWHRNASPSIVQDFAELLSAES